MPNDRPVTGRSQCRIHHPVNQFYDIQHLDGLSRSDTTGIIRVSFAERKG
ncbi:MAG: hypothetical protein NTZ39_04560 [Methanoregula sp.]|nr:hypothetical protein [Methanoregula sp.]